MSGQAWVNMSSGVVDKSIISILSGFQRTTPLGGWTGDHIVEHDHNCRIIRRKYSTNAINIDNYDHWNGHGPYNYHNPGK